MRKLISHLMLLLALIAFAIPASAQDVITRAASPELTVPQVGQERFSHEVGPLPVDNVRPAIQGFIHKDCVSGYAQFKAAQEQAPVLAPPQDGYFYGLIFGSFNYTTKGIYQYNLTAPCVKTPVLVGYQYSYQSACMISPNQFFYINYPTNIYSEADCTAGIMNLDTYQVEKSDYGWKYKGSGLAYDKETGRVYGSFGIDNGSSRGFGYIDLNTMEVTIIKNYIYIHGMGVANDGTFYYIKNSGEFGTIDKNTGDMTVISTSAPKSTYGCSGTIDPKTNTFYWATLNSADDSKLWTVDLATGQGSLVYERNDASEVRGMLFPFSEADPKCPGKPVINSIEHNGYSLSGVIKFTAPSTYYDGSAPAKGEIMTYRILANDQQIAYGTNIEYGKSYSVSITVPKAGMYEFKVILTNATGDCPAAMSSKFVGEDNPAAPSNVVAAYEGNTMSITWDPVTDGAQGGTFQGSVTYEVYDAVNDELLAEGLTDTSFSLSFVAPELRTVYQYAVVAVVHGDESEPAYSNNVVLGAIIPAWECPLATVDDLDGWTIVDANNDGITWKNNANGYTSITYNYQMAMDDWLISPPLAVEANSLYTISVEAAAYNQYYTEKVAVYWGTEPTPEAMTNVLVEPTALTTTTFTEFGKEIMTTEKGKIYVGIHGCSDAFMWDLFVRNFKISSGLMALVPTCPTDVNAVVSYTGEKTATISYKSPTTVVCGDEINEDTQLTKVEIYVNDELQYFDNAPIPGAVSHFTFDAPSDGYYEFKVIAYNKYGAGEPAPLKVFIGINIPGTPLNAKAVEVSDGVVDITWDAPETDIDGNTINPSFVTYTVVCPLGNGNFEVIAEGITAKEVRGYQVCETGKQIFTRFEIYAESTYGMNEVPAFTPLAAYGTPYTTPYTETFANGYVLHEYAYGDNGMVQEGWCDDNTYSNLQSRNGDNGYLLIANLYPMFGFDGIFLMESGKINIEDDDAVVEFWTVNPGATNREQVYVTCEGQTVCIGTHDGTNDPIMEWNRVQMPIGMFAGKTVQVQIYIFTKTLAVFDDIRIGKPLQTDLKADNILVPNVINTEKEFDVECTISNFGAAKVAGSAYSIALYSEGDMLDTINKDLPDLEPGDTYTCSFTQPAFDLFMTGSINFNFEIVCATDQDQTNNSSASAHASVVNTNLPTTNLTGELNAAGNPVLTWDTPAIDITNGSAEEEGFESTSYPAFAYTNFGNWTLFSGNTSATGAYNDAAFPNMGYVGGWILFDAASQGMLDNQYFAPADEGKRYLAAFYHNDAKSNDAWLVSPILSGEAQTITFQAKSISTDYDEETIACYYSLSGTNKADFVEVDINGYRGALTTTWTEYSFEIPAGAKHFAIVSTAAYQFATLLDNITYVSGPSAFENLKLTGYKIYRDEELLASVGVSVNSYVDASATVGPHYYNVTAVYNEGQSAPSNTVKLTRQSTTGLDAVEAASAVTVEAKEIVVTGAETVVIVAADGKVIYKGAGEARVAVATGVYVVKTNDQVVKVVVK